MNKADIAAHFDRVAHVRDRWRKRNYYYHQTIEQLCQAHIPAGSSVLDVGCGTGDLLACVKPSFGVGIDLSYRMIEQARRKYPDLHFLVGDAEALPLNMKFEYIIISDVIGHWYDIQVTLEKFHHHLLPEAKIIITYFNFVWYLALKLGERLGLKMPEHQQNWLGRKDIENLLYLTDYTILESGVKLLLPKKIPLLSYWLNEKFINSFFGRHFSLVQYFIAQPGLEPAIQKNLSCSVVVPCRNERGNIAPAIERIPNMGSHTEIIFIDGQSTDGTIEEIKKQIKRWQGVKDIRLIHQVPPEPEGQNEATPANLMLKLGKGDAVRKAFAAARGDVLMILDADLTVAPEDLPKFFKAIAQGKGRFVNGTRLVYPMEGKSMKFFNMLGNKFFSIIFTWLLKQRIKDTLCGTKVLFKSDYEKIVAGRSYFGDFDPFGDFDLLFGAARLGIPIIEVPVRYRRRLYGDSKVRLFKHGLLLLRMSWIGFKRFKLASWFNRKGLFTGTAELPGVAKSEIKKSKILT